MIADKQVLVVDRAGGAFTGVMEELDLLGFRVVWVPSFVAALEFVAVSPGLSLIIASAAAADEGGQEFLVQLKAMCPKLPVIWGARATASVKPSRGPSPDSLIPEPFRPDALRNAMLGLLAEHFYPPAIAEAIKSSALQVLGSLGEFRVEGDAFLAANETALSDLSAIISFSGGAIGHLMVSTTSEHASILYNQFVPGSRAVPIDRLEDCVGEICNRILGRINAYFAQRGVSIQQTTPLFMRASGKTMRYPGRRPSFAVQLTRGDARVGLEYYLADFDRKVHGEPTEDVLDSGEIRLF